MVSLTIQPIGRKTGALVTGAAGGLGRAICLKLADCGVFVAATDVDRESLESVLAELTGDGVGAVGIPLDVTNADQVETALAEAVEVAGGIDIVVNLAGVIRNQVVVKIDDRDFDQVMATHLKGTLNVMRAALPAMRERGYGRIVNMSSVAVRGSVAGGAYGAAKGGIEGLTRSAALESAKYGITVNCVAPGLVDAGMFRTVPEDYQRESAAKIPAGRIGTAAEVAECVAFLAGPGAGYVTGQTLTVCGGLTLGF